MCNRFRLTANQASIMRAAGLEPPYPDDEWYPPPREIFPTGGKTPRFGLTIRRSAEGNRGLLFTAMEWGFPTQIPSKRDPKVKLTKYVTNARNLDSSFWRPSLASPERRCLVPFTHFAEPHPERGTGDDGLPRQMWFSLPDQPVGMFAGLWRETERGPAFAFVTTEPNDLIRPTHEKAMPAILPPAAQSPWLDGTAEEARALIKPYKGPMAQQIATPPLE